MFYFFVIGAG